MNSNDKIQQAIEGHHNAVDAYSRVSKQREVLASKSADAEAELVRVLKAQNCEALYGNLLYRVDDTGRLVETQTKIRVIANA